MNAWRPLLLAAVSFAVLATAARSALTPATPQAIYAPFTFEPRPGLGGWQLLRSEPLGIHGPIAANGALLAARRYVFAHAVAGPLEVRMRYLVDTDGDVSVYGRDFEPAFPTSPASARLRQRPGTGFWALSADPKRAYLSACTNPRGGSTVSAEQFDLNRRTYDLRPERWVSWLFNREYLFDRRCLWTRMSMTLGANGTEAAYRTLENAWLAWSDKLNRNFPEP